MDEDRMSGSAAPAADVNQDARALDKTHPASLLGERARVAAALPTGAQRSLYNMERLRFRRALDRLRVPTTAPISDLQWLPTAGQAIEREPGETLAQQIWHAGHVSALLVVDPVVIAGTQTGGVWLVNHYPGAIPLAASHPATALSNDWDNPDVTCLAWAPGSSDQFYAGCGGDGALYFVELDRVLGGMERKRSGPLPLPGPVAVNGIVVLEGLRRMALACSDGVYWSPIPAAPGDASGYVWRAALGLDPARYGGLAEGPDGGLVAAAWGAKTPGGPHGLFRGRWQGGDLVFEPAAIHGVAPGGMQRTSVASCAAQRAQMYAVAAGGETDGSDFAIYAVLASTDGGASWTAVAKPGPDVTGFQGNYNNVIAVSPYRPQVVALGWRRGGVFLSNDGGQSWTPPHVNVGDQRDENLHGDVHALAFARFYDAANRDWIFIGSDGGVADTADLGATYESGYSKQLRNLQLSSGPYDMTLAVSSRRPGLMAAGTQDNGNIFCYRESHRPWWFRVEGGDGAYNRILDSLGSGALLRYNNEHIVNGVNIGNHARISFWDAARERFPEDFGRVVPADGDAAGLERPLLETVRAPAWGRNNRLMYALAASGSVVYGLFSSADGADATFARLADLGAPPTAIDSHDGATVVVATSKTSQWARQAHAQIVLLNPATGAVTDLPLPPQDAAGGFSRLAAPEANRVFALHSSGRIIRWDGAAWHDTAGGGFVVFEADPRPGSRRLFAATDTAVFVSDDDGASWAAASRGLPACPHCCDLRVADDGKGGQILYLATHGRAAWWAQIDYQEKGPDFSHVPALVGEAVGSVISDGGGLFRVGGHIVRVPPRQPYVDIMSALAIDDIARGMSPEAGRQVRLAALQTVRAVAEAQIREVEQQR